MALQTSGAISLNEIHVEAGGTSGLLEGDVVNLTTEGNNAAQDADNIEDL